MADENTQGAAGEPKPGAPESASNPSPATPPTGTAPTASAGTTPSESSTAPAGTPTSPAKGSGPKPPRKPIGRQIKDSWNALVLFKRFCVLTFIAVWNLPGFLNIMQAKKIRRTGRGRIRGYSKSIYLYPLIPTTLLLSLLAVSGVSPILLGTIHALLLWFVILVIAENIRGRSQYAVLGSILGIAGLWIALEYGGHYDISGAIQRFVGDIAPQFSIGESLLLAIGFIVSVAIARWRSGRESCIEQNGNNYVSRDLEGDTPYPINEWRIRARTSDMLERLWMSAVDLRILSNFAGGNKAHPDDVGEERAQYVLGNVPCGRWVEAELLAAAAAYDVEPPKKTATA